MAKIAGMKAIFLLSLSLLAAGILLKGPPSDPDLYFGRTQLWGVTIFSLGYCVCVASWGRLFLMRLAFGETGWAVSVATGTALASVFGFVLGHLGLAGYSSGPWILLAVLMGPAFCALEKPGSPVARVPRGIAWYVGAAALAYVAASRICNAQILHGAGDPLVYHLYGPRLWAEAGRIFMPTWEPIVLQCSWWEMQLLLAQSMLGSPAGGGLIEAQLFGQALHVLAGVGGCFLCLERLFRDGSRPRFWIFPVLLASLLSFELATTSALAKNDWGVMLWGLAGAILVLDRASTKTLSLGAWLLGLASIAKPNSIYFTLSVLAGWAVLEARLRGRAEPAQWARSGALIAFFFALGIAPIAVRNFILTGNPFFPFIMKGTNPALFTPGELRFRLGQPVEWRLEPGFWWRKLQWLVSESWANACVYLLPFVGYFSRRPALRRCAWIALASAIWIHMVEIPNSIVRWAGVPLMLAPSLFLLFSIELLNRLKTGPFASIRCQSAFSVALSLLLAWKTSIPFYWVLPESMTPSQILRRQATHWGGDSKAWLRLHADPKDKIFSIGDNELYYVSALRASSIKGDVEAATATDLLTSPEAVAQALRGLGIRYVLDTSQPGTLHYYPQAVLLERLAHAQPESIVYQGERSSVIDLLLLEGGPIRR